MTTKPYKILLVEDSVDFQDLVLLVLKPIADITVVSSVRQALEEVQKMHFDLLLLDVMLDDGDGFSLAAQLREHKKFENLPLIFLTSKNNIEDKTTGFKLGAEDYIVKPFDLEELRLRVQTRLERSSNRKRIDDMIHGDLRIDVAMQRVYAVSDGHNLDLTPLEFKLLFHLVSNEDQPVSRDKLITSIWGKGVQMTRSIDTHINSLRKKLGPSANCIQSVYGIGYLFTTKPPQV